MNTQVDALTCQAATGPKISHAALLMGSQVVKWSLRLIFVLVVARELGPQRFVVSLDLIMRSVAVEIGETDLEPLP